MARHKTRPIMAIASLSLLLVAVGFPQADRQAAARAFKEAAVLYAQQNYESAARKYEEAVRLDPNLGDAYFYLGNSYDNLFKATRRGDAENDAFLQKATELYQIASERAQTPRLRKLSLEYLVNAYGVDKLNEPHKAEEILLRMIEADPADVGSYFALAKLKENKGDYDGAEEMLLRTRAAKPRDAAVYGQLAGFYNRQGQFEKTTATYRDWAEIDPANPEVPYTLASFYWDKAYHDSGLNESAKRDMVAKGVQEVDVALQLKPDYVEALVRKGLLLRLQAGFEKDRDRYNELIRQAQELTDRAVELQKKKQIR